MGKAQGHPRTVGGPSTYRFRTCAGLVLTAIISASLALLAQHHRSATVPPRCSAPLPNLFDRTPLNAGFPGVSLALKNVDRLVEAQYARGGIDGLIVAIVTRDGAIYERAIGPLKANETDVGKRGHVDRHSIFRLASGSKLFAALETWVLRERGALNLDDPVHKFFPDFTYLADGWGGTKDGRMASGPITVRQLASHMSGLTREFPRGDMLHWPHSLEGTGPPPDNGRGFPTTEETIEGLKILPLNVPTYHYPVYSNVAMGLLGQVNVAANKAFEADRHDTPKSWPELAQRDLFDPLGLNGSSFLVTPENRAHVAVASRLSEEVDYDFLDIMACSGGQMSSLSDYVKLMQTFLDPTRPESLLPPWVIREWMRPLHGWWADESTEIGMLWEIEKIRDSHNRPRRIFQKLGTLGASRSAFAINQDMAHGVAVLMTGTTPINDLVLDIFREMQPVLDRLLAADAAELYSGAWTPIDGNDKSKLTIKVMDGSLWMTELRLNGTNVLGVILPTPEPIALWSTGRLHEFRMVFASPSKNCMSSWTAIDDGYSQGHPNDLVYLTDDGLLHVPSVGTVFERQ